METTGKMMEIIQNAIEYFALFLSATMLIQVTNKALLIFQQSQYRFASLKKSLKFHFLNPNFFWPPCIFFYFYLHFWYIQLIFGVYLAFLLFWNLRKKPILKLKYTARIKRLYFVLIVLYTLLGSFLAWKFPLPHLSSGMILLLFLAPFVVYFGAFLLQPLECLILAHYLRKARRKLEKVAPVVIGITGSYGKTGTKNILNAFLRDEYNVLASPASYNTPAGLALTINRDLRSGHEVMIAEMGATHRKDIEKLVKFLRPKHGIVTAVGPQHLETFKSVEAIVREKMKLIESLPEDGVAVINKDSDPIRNYPLRRTGRTVTIGIATKADYRATDVKAGKEGSSFKINYAGKEVSVRTSLLGKHNIYNILAAFALGRELGIPEKEMIVKIEALEPVEHRLNPRCEGDLLILDDSFNSNPEGFKGALEVLSQFEKPRILITPGVVEGGKEERRINRNLAKKIASTCDFVFLVKTKASLAIKKGLDELGYHSVRVVEDFRKAMKTIKEEHSDAVVLIENDITDIYKI